MSKVKFWCTYVILLVTSVDIVKCIGTLRRVAVCCIVEMTVALSIYIYLSSSLSRLIVYF